MNITSFNSVCAERLREERKRLGFTQQEMADLIGVRQEMSSKYERGQASPGGDALAAFASIGGDVQYVLTGQRSSSPMTPEEKELLSIFRKMSLRDKVNLLGMAEVVGKTPTEITKPVLSARVANQFHEKVKVKVGQHLVGDIKGGNVVNMGKVKDSKPKDSKKPKKFLEE
jgi:transcriptional regulator with XRE-family HTH domain